MERIFWLRIRFYDRRRKREHVSIYEVREGEFRGEEFLIFEKPADFSYPPSGTEILRHIDGVVVFPATLRLQWPIGNGSPAHARTGYYPKISSRRAFWILSRWRAGTPAASA